MQIYIQDVLCRLDETKAGITSIFGRILKIDSTKKIVKKLAGRPAKTALWCTNVGNEYGQVLTSVMTAGEGHGLTPMLVGIINRYTNAQVSSPDVIYTDRDCCGASPLRHVLSKSTWKIEIKLDIWHFMRRIATGCSTDSHQLYSSFMGLLSNCIFHWNEDDISCLIKSKRNELTAKHLHLKTDADVMKHLSRYELALHCRRKTRGAAETTRLISQLIEAFSGEQGRDTLGVPLINQTRMKSIWEAQRKHVVCLQDPPQVPLYTRIGSTKKGGIELPNYRCARGSTSLESFHLHLNRFIPGTLASDVLFQAYIVDGLHRWNEDRGQAATANTSNQQSYSGLLRHSANVLGLKVLEKKVIPTYNEPRKYTGELIGVEYLYSQTGKVLEDYMKAIETLETVEEDDINTTAEDDELLEDRDPVDDLTVSIVGLNESSDSVQERPVVLPVQKEAKQPNKPSTSATQSLKLLEIPTPEDYKAMMSDTVPIDPLPTPVIQEESPTPVIQEESSVQAAEGTIDSESENDESVGPDFIPGYGKVQELAAYLVGLRHDRYLTNAQAKHVITLWSQLHDYDKAPTVFQERFSKEARGRFKAKKSVWNVVPGVESTERSMRGGPGAVPASWPSANRYTEAIIIRLLSLLPRNKTRFDSVTKAYYDIRQLLLQNGLVMAETSIQLPEISRGTLRQWHTKRGKDMDKLVVTQGMRFVQPSKTTSQSIPAAVDKMPQLPTGIREPHTFESPLNTAGSARFKGKRRSQVTATQSTPVQLTVPAFEQSTSQLTVPQLPHQVSSAPAKISSVQAQQSTPVVPAQRSIVSPGITPIAPPQLTVNIDGHSYMLTKVSQAAEISVQSTARGFNARL